ncbi:MAG: acyl-ACP--UDP-N-acetylglucosamine O-acyltransferase [Candidatus Omnitrophota bacterium]|nr:acyl-ACP--UDP-N-acetylglucosamine O-acyltransferase [Candidatus Omnitrophota bacterium]
MIKISPLAQVGKGARIADGVEVGPFAIIEDGAQLASGVKVWANAYICAGTIVGESTEVHMGAILGHLPQDLAFDKNKKTFLEIGSRCVIREHVTLHRSTKEDSPTVVGDDCYLMAVSHVGHDCHLGNNVIVANGALLAGHVTVEDGVFISGNVVVHQFCRIGALSMIGGFTGINKDVPPYMLARGASVIRAVNLIGLRRAKLPREVIAGIKEAYKILYMSNLNTAQALVEMKKLKPSKELSHLTNFIESSKRGICKSKESDAEYFE